MKHIILFIAFWSISLVVFSQDIKKLQKSWIKISTENLSQTEMNPDTLYTRYTFDKSKINISFSPGWDEYKMDWSIRGNHLTIGLSTYRVDELTDTSLVIVADGFRKFSFLAEEYLAAQEKYLDSIGVYNGKPLYKANKFITPRYLRGKSLRDVLQTTYDIRRANRFLVTFIITENGEVENIKIIKGIVDGFDDQIKKELQATSKAWKAATYKSIPIQTEMSYEIKYLDSFTH